MKERTFKQSVLEIIQIPVLLLELLSAWLALLLLKCRERQIGRPGDRSDGPVSNSAQLVSNATYKTSREIKALAIEEILCAIMGKCIYGPALDRVRKRFEEEEAGQRAVRTYPDRHLYAVARPSTNENIRRIKNVLWEMGESQLYTVLENAIKTKG